METKEMETNELDKLYNTILKDDYLTIAGRTFKSRLLLGTGKYPSTESLELAIKYSEAEIVTVALRRLNIKNINQSKSIIQAVQNTGALLLTNTSGAKDAQEAVKIARLAYNAGAGKWIKIEIHPNPKHLMPDPVETLKATEILVKEGFVVLPYMHADPVLAKRLEEAGASAVMPLGAPIGTNKGLQTKEFIQLIIEDSNVPVIVDAGLGSPADATLSLEMGADAVLVNTAIAISKDIPKMAYAFKWGVITGRLSYFANAKIISDYAVNTSPLNIFDIPTNENKM